MSKFIPGQRWISESEPELGLGTVVHTESGRVQVKFNSDEYFGLLNKHPDAAQWLSVGTNVQLLLDDTVYEVVE